MNGVEKELSDTGLVAVDKMGLEEALRRFEPLGSHSDNTTVRQRVALDQYRCVLAQPLVQLQVVGDIAELLLDLAHCLKVGRSVEGVATTEQERNQVAGDVTARYVETTGEVVEDDGFVDGDDVGYAVARVDNNTGAET